MMQTFLYWLAKSIVLCIQSLPLTCVAILGNGGGALTHLFDSRHRRVVRNNLRRAFPEKSETEIRLLARTTFRRIGENYACGVKTAVMSFEAILTRCQMIGTEKLSTPNRAAFVGPPSEFAAKGAPGAAPCNRIVAIGHFGNFELYTMIGRCVPGFRGATTYRALPQAGLDRLLRELREGSGCLCFERRTQARELARALNQKGIVLGLLSDQHAGNKGVWAPFFGVDCSTTSAPAIYALRYDSPLNTAIVYRVGLGRWQIEVGDEIPTHENGEPRTVEAIMCDVNQIFEAAIRRDPANWFWVHNRWKARPPQAPVKP
jgi:lauroyl/myristoyl acyltransferase